MENGNTPKWLLDTQNKSWEPEILISGITLTFLFILTHHAYNFCGMLVQHFAVTHGIAKALYVISLIILTGLKIILIIHLILRGIWTGFVGLSYVFPDGVKKEKLPEAQRNFKFEKPEAFVIKIEKICSLLFSFIFSSIPTLLSTLLIFLPVTFLYIIGLDLSLIRTITLGFILILVAVTLPFSILLSTKLKKSGISQKLETSIFSSILKIYLTNVGRVKMIAIFLLYFLIVISLSLADFSQFQFRNDTSSDLPVKENVVHINKNHYEALRNEKLRIRKAALDQFYVTGNKVGLFLSLYKGDLYTIKKLQDNPSLAKEFDTAPADGEYIGLPDLYRITIDGKVIPGLRWYSTENIHTNQDGIITNIPLDTVESGYHVLKIDKLLWHIKKKKMKLIKNWEVIPFEIGKKTTARL